MALTGIELSSGIVIGSIDPVDKKYGPYDTLATAKSEIGETLRYRGLTIGITGSGYLEEYWWSDGTTDSDLVLKSNPGASFPFTGSAQITGSLGVTGSITATSFSGSFSGSFEGNGSGLTNVDYNNLDNVPSGIVSSSVFTSPSSDQGTLEVEINGNATTVDLGLEETDNVTFNQVTATTQVTANEVTASSAVKVEDFTITQPNTTSFTITKELGDISFSGQNFLLGHQIFSGSVDVTSTRTVAIGNKIFQKASGSLSDNTAIGTNALQNISASDSNTAIGSSAGYKANLYLTGSNNTFLGYFASYANNVSNATAIGANTKVARSNSVILGDTTIATLRVGIGENDPDAKLHIKGEGTTTDTALLVQNNGGTDLLKVLDNGHITLSNVTGSSFTGSFTGDGSGLTGVDYSNLANVPSGIVSSSTQIVSNLVGQDVVVQSMSGSFSGSFEGDGSGLTNVPASGVVGLNLTRISTTNVTASVSEGADSFKLVSGSETPFKIDNDGITSGSFKGDGSGLTGVAYSNLTSVPVGIVSGSSQVDHNQTTNYVGNEHIDHSSVSILSGDGMSGGGSIVSSQTLTLDTGSTHFNDGVKAKLNTETVVSSSAQVDYNSISNVPSGIVSQSLLNDLTNGEVNQLKNINSTTISIAQWSYLGALNQSLSTGDDVIFRNGRFTGDLTVQGTVTSLQTTDLNIEDQFILLNSGSTEQSDSGLIFGRGNDLEVAQQGPSLFWDSSYNTGDGRLAVTSSLAWNNTSPTAEYHLAGVFEGSEANAEKAKANHVGNIRVESGEIYIYV